MTSETLVTLFLMVALGVRHGIDPEHLAIVDGVTLRAMESGRRWPSASGLWFALGHGAMITAMATVLVGPLALVRLPVWLQELVRWLPTAILLAVAVANLRELTGTDRTYRPAALKRNLLPRALRDSSHPLAVSLMGVLFAPLVDPASQAAVWGYVAGTSTSLLQVVLLGGLLTVSLAATCTLEAHAIVRLAHAPGASAAARRRLVGWAIVGFSFLIVAYTLVTAWLPAAIAWALRLLAIAVMAFVLCAVSAGLLAVAGRLAHCNGHRSRTPTLAQRRRVRHVRGLWWHRTVGKCCVEKASGAEYPIGRRTELLVDRPDSR